MNFSCSDGFVFDFKLGPRHRLGNIPAFLIVDIGGFGARGFEKDRSFADAGVCGFETRFGKDVEVGVFLKPRLEILRADEVVRVVVHGRSVRSVKAGLEFVHSEKAVVCAGLHASPVFAEGGTDGCRREERVGRMGHQVGSGGHICEVVGDDEVHAHEVAADFGLAVTNEDAVGIHKAFLGEDIAGVGIDDNLVDFLDLKQGVENPAEERLASELSEVFSGDAGAVGFHWEQGDGGHILKPES